MQRRRALFLIFAAVLATVLVLVFGRGEPATPPPEHGGSPLDSNGQAPTGVRSPAKHQDGPLVRVDVVTKERYVPPPPPRVIATTVLGQVLPVELLAGAGAGFDGAVDAAGGALVRIDWADARFVRQVARRAGESATCTLGARLQVHGRVHDEAGKPVVGATAWFGETDDSGHRREFVTDDEGRFAGDGPAGGGVPYVVRAAGRAAAWRSVTIEAPPVSLDMVLADAGVLDVQLAAVALSIAEARAFVVPLATVSSELAHFPFFLQVLSAGHAFGPDGDVSIGELPRGVEVGIVVRHPRALGTAAQRVLLKGERTRAVVPLKFVAGEWRATVVDQQGHALGSVQIWSRRPGQSLDPGNSQRFLPPHLDLLGACHAQSGADGTFAVGLVAAPDAILSLRAHGHAGRDLDAAQLVPLDAIVLPRFGGGEPEFVLAPPMPGVGWRATSNLGGGIEAALAADQPWRVAFPHAGRFDVSLTTYVGDEERGQRHLIDLHVTGSVPLVAPPPE